MGRRIGAVAFGLLLSVALAAPVLADTTPDPGNYRESGSALYVNAGASECGQTTCTDTFVYGAIVELQGGGSDAYVCVDQFTYPLRGGGRVDYFFGCASVAPDIAHDLSSASVDVTIFGESCGRRTCTPAEKSVAMSLTAFGDPNSYSSTQKNEYGNCIDTYRIRGQASDAEGTIEIDGASLFAFGQIGEESFTFSSRCR
ncbi:MAG TPA: hypothetical protein VFO73_04230 [Candidatus Limnocylindrales bacterium]|nr:hypothetical protein [Candidatus Limnocylindrales bacterium]